MLNHVGIDTGGTFTDFIFVEGDRVAVRKRPSTPDDPGRVITEAIGDDRRGMTVVHGSTVATNALLEGRGARTALLTTKGCADIIQIGRQDRPHIYALDWVPPAPLVPAGRRFEIDERIGAGGEVITPLSLAEIDTLADRLVADGVESVAVGFLFSPEYPDHERQVAERLAGRGMAVVTSSGILPELREYERFSTAVISAYVAPIMEGYLGRLEAALAPAHLYIMESGGGIMRSDRIVGQAVRTVISGPAGGVVAAHALSRSHARDLVAFDMGGTSTDVCLVSDGRIPHTHRFSIRGLPIGVPVVDVHTVGAGGGSLVWVDPGGALRVGPRSAGAVPGPICYGGGGHEATVTDANYFLGRLPRSVRLGGEMPLTSDGVEEALARTGREIGCSPIEVARGIVQVIEAEMARALRRITQERGVDPRGLSLVSFGGAGGLHAVSLARTLGMGEIIVPPEPGILSAAGMLLAPTVEITGSTVLEDLGPGMLERLERRAARIEAEARRRLREDRPECEALAVRELAMRFRGQSHEIDIPWRDGEDPRAAFLAEYRNRYGFVEDHRQVEVTSLRSRLQVAPACSELPGPGGVKRVAKAMSTPVFLEGATRPVDVPLLDRSSLEPGDRLAGPAIIEERSSTLWLPERTHLEVLDDLCLSVDPLAG